jgi:hypothetical protein
MPQVTGSETRQPAQFCAIVFVASAIPHRVPMLDRLCFTWTRLRSMDRPSVVVRTALALSNRMHTHRIPYFLSRLLMSTKSNRFVANSMKKMRAHRNTMQLCHTTPPRHRGRGGP